MIYFEHGHHGHVSDSSLKQQSWVLKVTLVPCLSRVQLFAASFFAVAILTLLVANRTRPQAWQMPRYPRSRRVKKVQEVFWF